MFAVPPKPAIAETIVSEYEPPMIVQLSPDCWSSEPENHLDPAPPTVCSGLTAMACAGSSTASTAMSAVNVKATRLMAPSMPQVGRFRHCSSASYYPHEPCDDRRDAVRLRRRARLLRRAGISGPRVPAVAPRPHGRARDAAP